MTWPTTAILFLIFGPPLLVLACLFWGVIGLMIADYTMPPKDLGLDKNAQILRISEPVRLRPSIQKLWSILDDN